MHQGSVPPDPNQPLLRQRHLAQDPLPLLQPQMAPKTKGSGFRLKIGLQSQPRTARITALLSRKLLLRTVLKQ
jgi:hypothetical protein